jgi:hypothetical protein
MPTHRLRVTRRALADLRLGKIYYGLPAEDLEGEHDLLGSFVKNRTEQPYGTESTRRVWPKCFNLHTRDPWRGITWYDEAHDICWLVGVSSQHNYALFEERSLNDEICPTAEDYADLELFTQKTEEAFIDLVCAQAPGLMALALTRPNTEHRMPLAGAVDTGVFVEVLVVPGEGEIEEVFVSFQLPPLPGLQVPSDFCEAIFWLLAPDAQEAEVDRDVGHHPRSGGKRAGEIIYRWRKP